MSDQKKIPGKVKKRPALEHWHLIALYLMIYDFCAVSGAYFLALWLRFDCHFSEITSLYLSA